MKSKQLASMIGGSVVAVIAIFWWSPTTAAVRTVTVFKSQACECCSAWVEHLEDSGFTVAGTETEALQAIKAEHGVGSHLASCHTALIDGYVVEGHVPADDIESMLRDAPDIVGLAVPGMIIGTPGMEVPGQPPRPYQVLAFDDQGETIVFSSR